MRAGTVMRAPTIIPAPSVEVERLIASITGTFSGGETAEEPGQRATPERRHGTTQQALVRKRAQDVGNGEPFWIRQLQPIDEDRRVEHAHAGAEHPDAHEIKNELPGRRLGQPQPHHGLDDDGHAGETRHRRRAGLHEVRAVFALRTVAVRHGAAENARQHLAAHEKADAEVHERRGDAPQRPENENPQGAQEKVVLPRSRGRQKPPANCGFCRRKRRDGGHGAGGLHETRAVFKTRRLDEARPARKPGECRPKLAEGGHPSAFPTADLCARDRRSPSG